MKTSELAALMGDPTIEAAQDSILAPIESERARNELLHRFCPVPLSQLPQDADIDWLWFGYLARGHITLLVGLWKAGKTTLVAYLLKAFGSSAELAGRCVHAKVLVVTEESAGLWRRRRDSLGLGDHVHVIMRPFLGRPAAADWQDLIDEIARLVRKNGYGVVVFDTITSLWPVRDENDAAGVLAALSPLHALTDAGAGLLLVHHPRKGDANQGQAARGSGALPGFVDVIIELRRLQAANPHDRRRVLTGFGRFDETPPEVVIELGKDGYQTVGAVADANCTDRAIIISELLPLTAPGCTLVELLAKWPAHRLPKPGKRTLSYDLRSGAENGKWQETGAGRKNDPYRYFRSDSILASPIPIAASNELSVVDSTDASKSTPSVA